MSTLGQTISGGLEQSNMSSDEEDDDIDDENDMKLGLEKDMSHKFDDINEDVDEGENFCLDDVRPMDSQSMDIHNQYLEENKQHRISNSFSWSENSETSGNFAQEEAFGNNPPNLDVIMENSIIEDGDFGAIQSPVVVEGQYLPSEQFNFLESEKQLKTLYDMRGTELDNLKHKLNESKIETMALQKELASLKSEKQVTVMHLEQNSILLNEKEAKLREYFSNQNMLEKQLDKVKSDNDKLKKKVESAESTIESLEKLVSDLQSIDGLKKSRELHSDFVKKLQSSHSDEMRDLKVKLASANSRADRYEQEVSAMENNLMKAKQGFDRNLQAKDAKILALSSDIETYKQQCDSLLKSVKTETSDEYESLKKENRELREKLQISENLEKMARDELRGFDMVLKLGLLKSIVPNDDSLEQLFQNKPINYDASDISIQQLTKLKDVTPISSDELKSATPKLLKVVLCNKKYREEIVKLQEIANSKQKELDIVKSRLRNVSADLYARTSLESQPQVSLSYIDDVSKAQVVEENILLQKEIHDLKQSLSAIKDVNTTLQKRGGLTNDEVSIALRKTNEKLDALLNSHVLFDNYHEELIKSNCNNFSAVMEISKLQERLFSMQATFEQNSNINNADIVCIKSILKDFIESTSIVKKEIASVLTDNINLRKKILECDKVIKEKINLQFELDKCRLECKDTIENLKKKAAQDLTLMKQEYIEENEKVLSKLKSDLEKVKNDALNLKNKEIDKMSKEMTIVKENYVEVCRSKDSVEKVSENLRQEVNSLDKENARLKKTILDRQVNNANVGESNYVQNNSLCTSSDCKNRILDMVREHEKEVLLLNNNVKDLQNISTCETSTNDANKFEELRSQYEKQNELLKLSYESKLLDLQQKYEHAINENVQLMRNEKCNKIENTESNELTKNTEQYMKSIEKLKQDLVEMEVAHEIEIKVITDKLLAEESKCKEMQCENEFYQNSLKSLLENIKKERQHYSKNVNNLQEQLESCKGKRTHLTEKYKKLLTRYNECKQAADVKIISGNEKLTKQREDGRRQLEHQHNEFKKYLTGAKDLYAQSILRMISKLEESKPTKSLIQCHIDNLNVLRRSILNLDIK